MISHGLLGSAAMDVPRELWKLTVDVAPYLLLGFLVAGLLAVLIPPELVERHLGGKGKLLPALKAALLGVPLPLCSCGVIPVAASLRRHGAGRAATISFLISTPQTGVDSILLTYGMLGPVFAVARPVAALLSGLFGGIVAGSIGDRDDGPGAEPGLRCEGACCVRRDGERHITRALRYGFVTLPDDLWRPMLVGLIVAAAVGAFLPPGFAAEYLGGGSLIKDLLAMFVMLALGIPIYVCATASVPVAAALLHAGVSPGAAFVFVMAGPATNAATIATVHKTMGRRAAIAYVATMAVSAFVAGFAMNWATVAVGHAMHAEHAAHALLPEWTRQLMGGLLAAIFIRAALADVLRRLGGKASQTQESTPAADITLCVKGMTCTHCAESVKKALQAVDGVTRAEVDLRSGKASVWGTSVDESLLRSAVEKLGYSLVSGSVKGSNCKSVLIEGKENKDGTERVQN